MTATPHHADGTASPWVQRWTPLVAPGASALDVACGRGRHMRWFAERDHAVTGVDRDTQALDAAREGFRIRVLLGMTAGVAQETTDAALEELRTAGVELVGTPVVNG